MHIPDGFLTPEVAAACAVPAIGAIGYGLRRASRELDERRVPLLGVTAEAIAAGLDGRFPTSDLASVYRNLDTLEQAGLVHHIHIGHGPGRYLLARGAGGYAVCDRCEAHVALTPAALAPVAATVRDACGFEPDFSHFAITGRCSSCVSTNQ